jgi:hypothetical protein
LRIADGMTGQYRRINLQYFSFIEKFPGAPQHRGPPQ